MKSFELLMSGLLRHGGLLLWWCGLLLAGWFPAWCAPLMGALALCLLLVTLFRLEAVWTGHAGWFWWGGGVLLSFLVLAGQRVFFPGWELGVDRLLLGGLVLAVPSLWPTGQVQRLLGNSAVFLALAQMAVRLGLVQQPLGNPILAGTLMALGAVAQGQRLTRGPWRWWDGLGLGLAVIGVLLSQSKAAYGLLLLGLTLTLNRLTRRTWLRLWLVLVLGLVLWGPVGGRIRQTLQDDPYALDRLRIWAVGGHLFGEHPWLGAGPGAFREATLRHPIPSRQGLVRYGRVSSGAHSDGIQMLAEMGVGFGIWVLAGLWLFWRYRRREAAEETLLLFLLLLASAFFNHLDRPLFLLLFWMLWAQVHRFPESRRCPWTRAHKWGATLLLVFLFLPAYLLPGIARIWPSGATWIQPWDAEPWMVRADEARRAWSRSRDIRDWLQLQDALWEARRRGVDREWYGLEEEAWLSLVSHGYRYPGQARELEMQARERLQRYPGNALFPYRLGRALLDLGARERARFWLLRSVEREPAFLEAWRWLFRCSGWSGDFCRKLEAEVLSERGLDPPRPGSYRDLILRVPPASAPPPRLPLVPGSS